VDAQPGDRITGVIGARIGIVTVLRQVTASLQGVASVDAALVGVVAVQHVAGDTALHGVTGFQTVAHITIVALNGHVHARSRLRLAGIHGAGIAIAAVLGQIQAHPDDRVTGVVGAGIGIVTVHRHEAASQNRVAIIDGTKVIIITDGGRSRFATSGRITGLGPVAHVSIVTDGRSSGLAAGHGIARFQAVTHVAVVTRNGDVETRSGLQVAGVCRAFVVIVAADGHEHAHAQLRVAQVLCAQVTVGADAADSTASVITAFLALARSELALSGNTLFAAGSTAAVGCTGGTVLPEFGVADSVPAALAAVRRARVAGFVFVAGFVAAGS
jgi:hypothetical protein